MTRRLLLRSLALAILVGVSVWTAGLALGAWTPLDIDRDWLRGYAWGSGWCVALYESRIQRRWDEL